MAAIWLETRSQSGLRLKNGLHEATLETLKSPAVKERIEAQAGRILGGSPEALDALVNDDIKRYGKIVREHGIKAE